MHGVVGREPAVRVVVRDLRVVQVVLGRVRHRIEKLSDKLVITANFNET